MAGEVKNPSKTIPKALLITVLLVTLTYLLPLFVSAGVNEPTWDTWIDGSFSAIASNIGGPFLAWTVTASSILGSVGLFLTDIALNSFALVGLAEEGLVPRVLAWFVA